MLVGRKALKDGAVSSILVPSWQSLKQLLGKIE